MKIEDVAAEFIKNYELGGKTILVGFSGGADSMCLLHVMHKLHKNLVAVHYNHNWRGDRAKEEQENCRKFCEKLGIEFYTETAPDDIKKNETEARELRYAFFERAINIYSADAVFTAHNFDDNAETILYRIAKGTGIVGLKGILPKRGIYYRPLIEIPRSEIEEYCKKFDLCPNFDESNSDTIHKRNLIRHDILPILEKINPEIKSALNSLGQIAVSESMIVDEYIGELSKSVFDGNKIKTQLFKELSSNVRQKIIYNLIYDSKFDYTMDTILNICKFVDDTIKAGKPSKYSLSSDFWLYVDLNVIEIIGTTKKNNNVIKVDKVGEYSFNSDTFIIEKCDRYEKQPDETSAIVDLSDFKELYIRTRKNGDIIHPLGFNGSMKLKKYLMEKHIPQHKRDRLLLLCDEKEVLWVAGVGLSDKIKTKGKPTHRISVVYKEGNNEYNYEKRN